MDFLKKRVGGQYAKVTTAEDHLGSAFTIDDDDDGDDEDLSLDQLEARHQRLLQEASTALESTESSVSWLKEERQQTAASVIKLTEAPELPGMRRRGCLPSACRRSSLPCSIL